MKKLINKIKTWIYSKKHINSEISSCVVTPMVQEDIRDLETRKRVAAAFEAQSEAIQTRALKAHSCKDPVGCKKKSCFKVAPDKIKAQKVITKEEMDEELGRSDN